jgi:ATP-dependent DNA ligase I
LPQNVDVLLADLAAAWRAIAGSSGRLAKTEVIARTLQRAAPDEVPIVVTYLGGDLRQRRSGVGWAAVRELPPPAGEPTLTLLEVDATFDRVAACAGKGSTTERRRLLGELLSAATDEEQQFLRALVVGEIRQGALAALVVDAVAKATELPVADVRRAVMVAGSIPPVARAALADGAAGLAGFGLEVGRAVQPMLAQTAPSVEAALERVGRAAVDWKLDGVRIQIHRARDDVRVFTRTLDDITARMPEAIELARGLPVSTVVLDGEAIALRDDGRPRPFQETARRLATHEREGSAVTTFLFDVLHLDGADLTREPTSSRFETLERIGGPHVVPRILTDDPEQARAFFDAAVAAGHEGVVVKALDAPYDAGRRGAGWLKVKPVHTLDLVVLAAEWGHGRRRGWLSNLHLGARDPVSGEFVMLGKTFKGLTDELLAWQTERLLALETARNDWQVFVRPELVVEIAFDGVQTSPRYPGGMALRFARVLRYRDDKPAAEADTIETVRAIHEASM